MKKILFVIGSLQAGGAERVASNLCSYWATSNEVTLVTGDIVENDFYPLGSEIKRISLSFDYGSKNVIKLLHEQYKRWVSIITVYRKENPDTIILSCSDISIRFLISLLFCRRKIIVCEHNNYFALKSKFKRFCRLLLYRKASKLLLLTTRDIDNYTKRFFPISKISVMPNPLGIENKEYIKNKNIFSLLAVGRLCEQKAFTRLIELFPKINDNCRLCIIGDGPEREVLQERINKLGLADRITLCGQVKNMNEYYSERSILLMTSIYEGLPMVIGEANAFGLPVVAYDCPTGPREMIESGVNGYLIEDGDAAKFSTSVNSLVENPELFEKMSKNSFTHAKTLSITEVCKRWEELDLNS